MCSLSQFLNDGKSLSFSDAMQDREVARKYVNLLVNGNFETYKRTAPIADKVATCLSVICSLSKEFELDWISEGVAMKPKDYQCDYLAAFGAYLELPLRTLSDLMTRLRFLGRRDSKLGFQRQLDQFLGTIASFSDGTLPHAPQPTTLLFAYLATAMEAHKLWSRRRTPVRALPWEIRVNHSGSRIFLRYNYCKRSGKFDKFGKPIITRSHMDYVLNIKLPAITMDGIKSVGSIYSDK